MSEPLRLSAADRVLVLAPHPDDESIACGGLLLAARDAGAARRVVTLTDGDNNPWPQRWIEKRWRIDAAARARWGARRRAEAQVALEVLGVAASERVFLGLPDAELTTLLMQGNDALPGPLRPQIEQFAPTHLALPALADRHPDHSAAHIAARLAVSGIASPPRLLAYSVHSDAQPLGGVSLSPTQRDAKRRAIASHHTQMALSGKRFLAFATEHEAYGEADLPPRDAHPVTARLHRSSVLDLHVRKRDLRGDLCVSVVLADVHGVARTWSLPLGVGGGARPSEPQDGAAVAIVEWRSNADSWTLELPLPAAFAAHTGYVKLARSRPGLVIFDRYGWQPVDFSSAR
jgi:LmbE family N-acetylglucosaminyl deacetylase